MTDPTRSGGLNSESTNSPPLGVTTGGMLLHAQSAYNAAAFRYRCALDQELADAIVERVRRELSYSTDVLLSVAIDYARCQR